MSLIQRSAIALAFVRSSFRAAVLACKDATVLAAVSACSRYLSVRTSPSLAACSRAATLFPKIRRDFEIPESVRDNLATYLTLVRPRMVRRSGCNALWVSPKGGPLSYSALWPVFARHTTERFGIRITTPRCARRCRNNVGDRSAGSNRKLTRPARPRRSAHHRKALQSRKRYRSKSNTFSRHC
jgi:hypothetical protein